MNDQKNISFHPQDETLFLRGVLNLSCLHDFCHQLQIGFSEYQKISNISFEQLQSEDSSIFALIMMILRYRKNNQLSFHLLHLPPSLISLMNLARLEALLKI